ncbi:helix-turn-helix domain-containing protein [Niabella ginsengisoli]|uniref:Helix-turn-helix transcriptional regulator n=1 Tax=Niabella ginsengisoli TaxID=522298 RepID=A0ABS9SJ80_9BACT|nr:helix-turn-helix transcriptional regulator [Niabella ginsengisoli]MCH5598375.1 helix-turn-helix transcriptional regulator [Niabella ginsengisoli]
MERRRKESFSVTTGSVQFYHREELHLNQNTQIPSKNINIEISEPLFKEFGFTEEELKKSTDNIAKTKLTILKIYKECLISDTFSQDSINMLLSNLACSQNYSEQFFHCPNWVYILHEFLNDCWDKSPSLKDLSNVLNLSPITISKYFPRYFGCTLGEYSRRLKIEKSLTLIQNSSASLTDIAFECGFADQSHFIRAFKQQTGFLPKKFRNL